MRPPAPSSTSGANERARALVAALIGTVHVFFAPRHAPLQERSFQPFAGVAVSATGVNEGTPPSSVAGT